MLGVDLPGPQFSQEALFMQETLHFLLQAKVVTSPLTSLFLFGLPEPHLHLCN